MEKDSISLAKLVGTDILARIPAFKEGQLVTLKLAAVETGGIWVESQEFMEEMFSGTPHTMTPKTWLFFLPFAQVLAIYALTRKTWISKRALE